MVRMLVDGPWSWADVQKIALVLGLMLAPRGGESSVKFQSLQAASRETA